MRTYWIGTILAAVALAGCATPAEQAARMEREMDRNVEIYGPACDRLGYKRDTDPWRNCVLNLTYRYDYDRFYGYYGYGRYYPMGATCMGGYGYGLLNCAPY